MDKVVDLRGMENDFSRMLDSWIGICKIGFEATYTSIKFTDNVWHNKVTGRRTVAFTDVPTKQGLQVQWATKSELAPLSEPFLSMAKCIVYQQVLVKKSSVKPCVILQFIRKVRDYCYETKKTIYELDEYDSRIWVSQLSKHPQTHCSWLFDKMREEKIWEFRKPKISSKNSYRALDEKEIDALTNRMTCLFSAYDRIDEKKEDGTDLFDPSHKMAICAAILLFSAPTRKNEVLSMLDNCLVDISSYMGSEEDCQELNPYFALWQKGSKGGDSGAKHVLASMLEATRDCIKRIKQLNQKRRKAVTFYESNGFSDPWLPTERLSLSSLNLFTADELSVMGLGFAKSHNPFRGEGIKNGSDNGRIREELNWHCVLYDWDKCKDHYSKAYDNAVRATKNELLSGDFEYTGKLGDLLFLQVSSSHSYDSLPTMFTYEHFRKALSPKYGDKCIFVRANIKYLASDGKECFAYLTTHEPRHWLTDQAKRSGALSDLIVNHWTRRKKNNQMESYQHLTPSELAEFTWDQGSAFERISIKPIDSEGNFAVRVRPERKTDLKTIRGLRNSGYITRKNEQEIVVNLTPFGLCEAQLYETPCLSLKQSKCIGCGEHWVIKGDRKTNNYLHQKNEEVKLLMLAQAKYLLKHRHLYDDELALFEHIELLVDKYVRTTNKGDLGVLADFIIDRFSEIKQIKDNNSLLEMADRAWIIRGFCRLLDSPSVEIGAGIRYDGENGNLQRKLPIPSVALALEEKDFEVKKLHADSRASQLSSKDYE